MKEVEWTELALKHISLIWDYIAADSVFYADKVTDGIIAATERLSDFSQMGRIVPEINKKNVREIFYASYRIMYEIRSDGVYITQIIHGAMDFKGE